MADISVNEYLRTKDGRIGKIISKKPVYENDKLDYYLYLTSLNEFFYTEKQIKECDWRMGKNLIDLIEVGDYVNGCSVYWGASAKGQGNKLLISSALINGMALEVVNIKDIVTHEQFNSIKYVLGGKEE